MLVLRATAKVLRSLPPAQQVTTPSDGALGDWYVNRLVIDRQPLVVLVSSTTLLAIIIPGRDLRTLPDRLPGIVAPRLRRLGLPPNVIDAEVATQLPVQVAKTVDPRVLGSLVLFTKELPCHLPIGGWDETSLPFVELKYWDMPCRASGPTKGVIHPAEAARRLLSERWGA